MCTKEERIVDAVGIGEKDKTDSRPLERKRTISLEKLLQSVALGNIKDDVLSSIAGRLARLDKKSLRKKRSKLRNFLKVKTLRN
ncbi:MAG: hypothetical protein MRJ65_12620 [Candidatus Brocadiaceae bacterium]|nr:hypothetical protein [Candidatus Brocadiaceae bacterium]